MKKQFLEGVKVGKKRDNSEYAAVWDDTLFTCKVDTTNIMVIKSILKCFELISSLRVNFHKRKIGGMGVDESEIKKFSLILNCGIMKVPFKYVGGNLRKQTFGNLWSIKLGVD